MQLLRSEPPILIAGQNTRGLSGLAQILQGLGYDVVTAVDGESALSLAARYRPSAVLLDMDMHGISGLEVAMELRADEQLRPLHLVAMTAGSLDETSQLWFEAGFDWMCRWPASVGELGDVLQRCGTLAPQTRTPTHATPARRFA